MLNSRRLARDVRRFAGKVVLTAEADAGNFR